MSDNQTINKLDDKIVKKCRKCGTKYKKTEKQQHKILCESKDKVLKIIKNKDKLKDSMSYDILLECIKMYNNQIIFENNMNKSLKKKKIRQTNFPSHISENIVKFVFYNIYKIMPTWDTDKGDLVVNEYSKRIECKGSINLYNGPPTFGSTEEWDYIYFVDGIETLDLKYKVYEFKIKNNSNKWKNLMVNKKETFYDQCKQKRRPRLSFEKICDQLNDEYRLIFNGHISELNNIL